jgi:hypothetical protein
MNMKHNISRRDFIGAMAAAPLLRQDGDWVDLFDGKNIDGWRPQRLPEGQTSWKVVDGTLSADGPMCHLFYAGPVRNADFKNFELEVEAMASPSSNSGIYFHTAYQETGWPRKGFEIQINNSQAREFKKTGSLFNVRNNYKQFVADNQWFKTNILVRGKNIQIRVNGMLMVDYIEPTPPHVPAGGMEKQRMLDHGTFALQCHDANSKARFRSVRVRPLPDDASTPGAVTITADEIFKKIIDIGSGNRDIPMLDLHVHPKNGLTVEQALALSRASGIQYGLAVNCGQSQPVTDDAGALKWIESLKGLPVFIAMQAEGREWLGMFSRSVVSQFDYVFTDSMTWTDNHGKRMRTWIAEEVGRIDDPQEFMNTLVDRAAGILEKEPVDIYVNPTYLPDVISKDYEMLWTEERRRRIAQAAAKNGVAVEINNRYKLPSASFIKLMKSEGCKFTIGTNNADATDVGRCEYALNMITECKLTHDDFWVPLQPGSTKAVERKGGILKA